MSDRLVQQIDGGQTRTVQFSKCLDSPNIVLLGDPGAGKSHLFKAFAPANALFRARDFLNVPVESLRKHPTLFIDALDEKRSGRADASPIDLIVSRLISLKPDCVRISCRAADWLGASDLGAFRPYFDVSGGVTILSLESLTDQERVAVLIENECNDAPAFISEAISRGLGDLLGNPQNLTMLLKVVKSHAWPRTKSELYEKAVEVLLVEHNEEHQHKDAGAFAAKELLRAAGAACAARLISDVSGISLNSVMVNDCPSYRDLSFIPSRELHAALTRRAFTRIGVPDAVDYSHRTVAEFLAARFLAEQVQQGLPFARVRAILSVDGRPASELRGLHAWLAVLLQEHAAELIAADPFGVLSYGDSAALGTSERDILLEELSALAEKDPWFRRGDWAAAPLRGLAGPDMVAPFRRILRKSKSYSLLSLVLDAASVGLPMPELVPDLLRVLLNPARGDGLRSLALQALLHIGPSTHAECVAAYASISAEDGAFFLRARLSKRLLSERLLSPDDISSLLNDALVYRKGDQVSGSLYNFSDQVPAQFLRSVLDGIEFERLTRDGPDSSQIREAVNVIDRLLARYIELYPNDFENAAKWLVKRARVTRQRGYEGDRLLRNALSENSSRHKELIDATFPLIEETGAWPIVVRLGQTLPGAAGFGEILTWALTKLEGKIDPLYFAIAMECVYWTHPLRRDDFDYLLTLASANPELQSICAAACSSPVPDWRIEESERRAAFAAKQVEDRDRSCRAFDSHAESIKNGTHRGWLSHLAHIYFRLYADCDGDSSPRARLVSIFGEDRATAAIAGLRAVAATTHWPNLREILETHANEKVFGWWYAIVAGLSEAVATRDDLTRFSPNFLSSALAINILYPTLDHSGNTSTIARYSWVSWFAERYPERYVRTLLTIVTSRLERGSQYIDGFSELMDSPANYLRGVVKKLMQRFPRAPNQYLVQLLRVWIDQQASKPDTRLLSLTLRKVDCSNSYALWLSAGLIVDFKAFRKHLRTLKTKEDQQALVWASRDLSGYSRLVSIEYLEHMFLLACRCFRRQDMPLESTGDRSGWDASQYSLGLLQKISSSTDKSATAALERSLRDKRIRDFHDDIRHALAQQQIRRIDAEYRQPSWNATLATLANGAPANIADLQALVIAELRDLQVYLLGSNIDAFKNFWNEEHHGKVESPKPENSCRNAVIHELRHRLGRHGIRVEPEGHMARQKRVDIAVTLGGMKLVIELKRHYHPELWTAASTQLDRYYVRDPESNGFGIYLVLWFGKRHVIPFPGAGIARPNGANELEIALIRRIPEEHRARIACVVLDVSEGSGRPAVVKERVARRPMVDSAGVKYVRGRLTKRMKTGRP